MSELRDLLRDAHQRAARDNANLSSQLVIAMAQAGAPFEKAVASALLSLGTLHAPVTEARRFFKDSSVTVDDVLASGRLVPGFGNSFYKGRIDPAFVELDARIKAAGGGWWFECWFCASEMNQKASLAPNAAAYTAVVCEIEGVAEGTELALVIEARLPVWAELWAENKPRKELWRG